MLGCERLPGEHAMRSDDDHNVYDNNFDHDDFNNHDQHDFDDDYHNNIDNDDSGDNHDNCADDHNHSGNNHYDFCRLLDRLDGSVLPESGCWCVLLAT